MDVEKDKYIKYEFSECKKRNFFENNRIKFILS